MQSIGHIPSPYTQTQFQKRQKAWDKDKERKQDSKYKARKRECKKEKTNRSQPLATHAEYLYKEGVPKPNAAEREFEKREGKCKCKQNENQGAVCEAYVGAIIQEMEDLQFHALPSAHARGNAKTFNND